jgi:hypothetical protein
MSSISLCRHSRSRLLASLILAECPAGVSGASCRRCPCSWRDIVTPLALSRPVRVKTCRHPQRWNHEPAGEPADVAAEARDRTRDARRAKEATYA